MIDAFGYIIQADGFYPDLTAYEEMRMRLGLQYFGMYITHLSW